MTRRFAGPLVAVALSACAVTTHDDTPGRIAAVVTPLTTAYEITRVVVTVTPAGVSQELTLRPYDGAFAGTLFSPPGEQTVEATAYAGTVPVGSGSATVTVVANATATVVLRILDASGPPPAPDHGPVLTSVSVSNAAPLQGDRIAVSATALDPDGDPVAFQWSSSCGGAFAAPAEPSTTWLAASAGPCTLTVTVASRGLSDLLSVNVTVSAFTGLTGGSGGTP